MSLTKEAKQEIVDKHGSSKTDTGSTTGQVALLTQRIPELSERLRTDPRGHSARAAQARGPAAPLSQLSPEA